MESNEKEFFGNLDTQISILEGYEIMYHFLKNYYDASGSIDLTDILSAGKPLDDGLPMDTSFWLYWKKGFEIIKNKRN
jgi:hypothetical protein